jgi:hypothetical protein
MPGWFVHEYANVPAAVNWRENDPLVWSGEVGPPAKVTLCEAMVFCQFHVTVVLTGTVVDDGLKALSVTLI